ncbi:MAG: Wzz/FepE/Etk N-terminal domain-containing protein [Capsulimonadaceae bacterium]|nr:Wzz/FepE/Etk N-terminal domain-containing protein [Capsulimonadaceae bacterium]
MASAPDSEEITIDTKLLREILRSKARNWLIRGTLAAAVLSVIVLATTPQQFTATTTVAVQQSQGAITSLAALAGGKTNPRYIGVIASRTAAEQVAKQIDLAHVPGYRFKKSRDLPEFLQKHVKAVDDPASGLLAITVSLPGPPILGPRAQRALIEKKAADAANGYYDALVRYYLDTDNDRETVLLRGADEQTKEARREYDESVHNLLLFTNALKNVDPRSTPTISKDVPAPTQDEIGALYTQLARVDAQLGASQATQGAQEALTAKLLGSVNMVPTEDPLLAEARNKVLQDKAELDKLQVTYGPDYPGVILARNQLRTDNSVLHTQVQGVLQRRTSEQVLTSSQRQGLLAQRQVIQIQISEAARRLGKGRELSGVMGKLMNEVQIRLEILKATVSEAAKVRLENAAAQSRVSVVDSAIPPDRGEPRPSMMVGGVIALVLLAYAVSCLAAYLKAVNAKTGKQST